MTMSLVQTVTVGAGGAASIDFTTIPQDADDLLIVLSGRNTSTGNSIVFRINGDTAANYRYRRLFGTGSATGSDNGTADTFGLFGNVATSGSTASTFGNVALYITNYKSSVAKSWSSDSVGENNAVASPQEIIAGLWTGTAAISSLSIYVSGANLAQHSTASLYKIKKA